VEYLRSGDPLRAQRLLDGNDLQTLEPAATFVSAWEIAG